MPSQPCDIIDLVPSRLVSSAQLLSPESPPHHLNCLSQAYSCSDHYIDAMVARVKAQLRAF